MLHADPIIFHPSRKYQTKTFYCIYSYIPLHRSVHKTKLKMVNQVAKVGEVCLALGLDGAATKEIRAELINFRKEYARIHGKDLTTASMKDPRSKDTEKLTLAYVEHGLPEYGIPPGKDRWSADGLEARTAPDGTRLIYSKHKET